MLCKWAPPDCRSKRMGTHLRNVGCRREPRWPWEGWGSCPGIPGIPLVMSWTCRVTPECLDRHLWGLPRLGCQQCCCNLLQQEWVGHTSSRQLLEQLHLPFTWVQGTHLQARVHLHIPQNLLKPQALLEW